jgi:superfamily I DNA/RNA helicase
VHQVHLDQRAGQVVGVAQAHAIEGRFVGIICPQRCRREVEAALAANNVEWSSGDRGELGAAINLVSPQEAKGLEFDAVIVVEPEQIVADYERGHRMLYIALTRTTGYVDVVCVGEPLPLTVPTPSITSEKDDAPTFDARDVRRLAEHIAAQVSNAAPQPFWDQVLASATRILAEFDER